MEALKLVTFLLSNDFRLYFDCLVGFPFLFKAICLRELLLAQPRPLVPEIAPRLGLIGGIPVQHQGSHQGSACAKIIPQAPSYCCFSNLRCPSLCRFGTSAFTFVIFVKFQLFVFGGVVRWLRFLHLSNGFDTFALLLELKSFRKPRICKNR